MDRKDLHEPVWVPRVVVIGAQFDQLQQHGGEQGLREAGNLLDAALARPQARFQYDEHPDLADLAAAYTYGITKIHHPFHDGKKRTGFVIAAIFLALNGAELEAAEGDVVDVMLGVVFSPRAESVSRLGVLNPARGRTHEEVPLQR